jgi:hypothetical protein
MPVSTAWSGFQGTRSPPMLSASRSANASVDRLVLARGMVESVDAAAAVDDVTDRAGSDGMEEASCRLCHVRSCVDIGARTRLAAGVGPDGFTGGQPAKRLDALGEFRRTEPREAGFIAKTATLAS